MALHLILLCSLERSVRRRSAPGCPAWIPALAKPRSGWQLYGTSPRLVVALQCTPGSLMGSTGCLKCYGFELISRNASRCGRLKGLPSRLPLIASPLTHQQVR